MLKTEDVNKILEVNDSYQQPEKLLKLMLDDDKRDDTFRQFLELETDMSYEWFQGIFENEHADRKRKKQDFTPLSIGKLLAKLVGSNNHYFESAVGNGGLLIQAWNEHRLQSTIGKYNPKAYWYQAEELSDRSIPFLIFNMAIRGMNGVILHGDSLIRKFKEVYFIRNMDDFYGGFSEVIVMPKTDELKEFLNIHEWSD